MGVPKEDIQLIDKKGLRIDGRKADEIRPIHIEAGVLHRADGSSYLEWGGNKVICAVYGPREAMPRRIQNARKAVVQCRYNMAAFSVDDRKRPGPDRRSAEISKVISDAFENVILTEQFPRASIDVSMEILEAAAGTRCAALTAAAVALADAGIPMKGMVSAVAAGKAGGKVILDLGKEEDNYGEADLPIAINHTTGEIVLLQMDGNLSPEEFDEAVDLAAEGCKKVLEFQREALLRRMATVQAERDAASEEAGQDPGVDVDEDDPFDDETVASRSERRESDDRRGDDRGRGRGPGGRGGSGGRGGPSGGRGGSSGGRGGSSGGRSGAGGRRGASPKKEA